MLGVAAELEESAAHTETLLESVRSRQEGCPQTLLQAAASRNAWYRFEPCTNAYGIRGVYNIIAAECIVYY